MSIESDFFDAFTVQTLAGMADCGSPDSSTSPGALFLRHIADSMPEAMKRIAEGEDVSNVASEVAQSAPDVSTYIRWQEFTDLAAWQEEDELADFGPIDPEDITESVAGVALRAIALWLTHALIQDAQKSEIFGGSDDDDDDSYTELGHEDGGWDANQI